MVHGRRVVGLEPAWLREISQQLCSSRTIVIRMLFPIAFIIVMSLVVGGLVGGIMCARRWDVKKGALSARQKIQLLILFTPAAVFLGVILLYLITFITTHGT
jgi:nitrogen fixation/metabolism regulation signal transduction histidine kinase